MKIDGLSFYKNNPEIPDCRISYYISFVQIIWVDRILSYWCDNRVSYNHWIGFYCILSDSGDTVYQRGKPYDCQNP